MKSENTTMNSSRKPRCSYISKIGASCHAHPDPGKKYGFFHDPEQKKKPAPARQQAAEIHSQESEIKTALPPGLPVIPLQKASDAASLMAETINQLRGGEMDLDAARAIGYLTNLLLRSRKEAALQVAAEPLAETINQFRRGEIDLRTAKTIGYLVSLMLRCLNEAALEEQLDPSETDRRTQYGPAQQIIRATKPDHAAPNTTSPELPPTVPES